ncbi:DUF2953 domain-containing protein [Alkalihalobacterium bogoriense]|uniref:DUF2953 domain-containing protein n=1 Tax=Alkalihalobacterium bogoriense TaxID=246272 RepID=UPI00047EDCA7|nr:DUF2953 domain-containing protein [Alkalihalobacterium bogoriense]
MNWLYGTLLILLLIFLILIITKLRIHILYSHHGHDDELTVRVRAWKIFSYTMKMPLIKIDKDSASLIVEEEQHIGNVDTEEKLKITAEEIWNKFQQFKDFLEHIVGLHRIVRKFLRHIKISQFTWHSHIGAHDASVTGFLTGMAWSVKGSVVGAISNYMRLMVNPNVTVTPHFQTTTTRTDISCMLSFRVGYAIIAGLLIVRHWKRRPVLFKKVDEKVSG